MREVFVCGEERQIVPDGELRKQCVNGADLDTRFATCISQTCSTDVIISIRLEQGQSGKTFDDLSLRLGTRETLQKLLKDEPCGYHNVCPEQGFFEFVDFRFGSFNITAKSQRPNACVNEQRHLRRDRSAL